MPYSDFTLRKIIGKGSYAIVYKVKKYNNKYYAMKVVNIRYMKKKQRKDALNEIQLLSKLSHKNIVKYYEAFYGKGKHKLYSIIEYVPNGDLNNYIYKYIRSNTYIYEKDIWYIFSQILDGLFYLHTNKIIHRDLKPANILISKNNIIKITDFNSSTIIKNLFAITQVGTPYYISPEIFSGKPYNEKSDIWSLGCVLYELVTLKKPFNAKNILSLSRRVRKGRYKPISTSIYSDKLCNVIYSLLSVDTYKRPSTYQLINIPEIKVFTKIFEKKKLISLPLTEINKYRKIQQKNVDKSRKIKIPLNNNFKILPRSNYTPRILPDIKKKNVKRYLVFKSTNYQPKTNIYKKYQL